MKIPVRNLYYLLLYAHDALDELDVVDAGSLPETRIADLFGHVLASGINHLVRRGIDRDYSPRREELATVRGRIDVATSMKGGSLARGKVLCEFDELTPDVTLNRILRATARRMLKDDTLDADVRIRLSVAHRRLDGIGDIHLTNQIFRAVRLHRNNRFYRFLLGICRIVHTHHLADEKSGELQFRDFERDDRRMRQLFERFVLTFYRRHQSNFEVGRKRLRWVASGETVWLPRMITDIRLMNAERQIIIETKFTPRSWQQHRGPETVRSEHLYQLFAYLSNLRAVVEQSISIEGILLYPTVGVAPNIRCILHGYPIRITSINLAKNWTSIHNDLLSLLT